MDLFALALRHETTLFTKAAEKKDGITVSSVIEAPSILPALLSGEQDAVYRFFTNVAALVKRKDAPLTLSLPASLVLMNCGFLENVPQNYLQKELDRFAYRLLRLEPTDPYTVDKAMILTQRKSVWLTSAGVEKRYVELLWEAVLKAGMVLASVEVEAIAAFRNTEFQEPCGYFELLDNSIFISGFSPEHGMFTVQSQFSAQENIDQALQHAIALFDTAVSDTFLKTISSPLPIYVNGQDYYQVRACQSRIHERLLPLTLSGTVTSKAYSAEQLQDYALPIGLLLQPVFERRARLEKIRSDKSRSK